MRLETLIKPIREYILSSSPMSEDAKVQGISADSKKIAQGYLFVGIKGTREDGNQFIQEAIEHGARALVVQTSGRGLGGIPADITVIEVKDSRAALSRLAAAWYGYPSSKLKVVGVTGTNGKTTVTYLIEAILKEARRSPGVIGTVNYRFGNKRISAKNTTPGPLELESLFSHMVEAKVRYAIMEVSSHSLVQERIDAVKFHSAIFTNLTHDHLDYHKTLQRYFEAKSKLFASLDAGAFCVLNNDDPFARKLKKMTRASTVTYAIDTKADYRGSDICLAEAQTQFRVKTPSGSAFFTTPLIGRHNVYNVLAAVAWALEEGIAMNSLRAAVQKFGVVPGRLERIKGRGDFSVFVDYAHTDDALTNVITSLRQVTRKRVIVVFGCGGDRDRSKRPKMGRVATELADYAIITSDNPRSEDPRAIIEDIKRGIRKRNYCVIPDRLQAIRKALSLALPGDSLLVAGKGHENYQVVKNRITHFDDREVIRACLKSTN